MMRVPLQDGRVAKRMRLIVAPAEFARTGDNIAYVNGEIGPEIAAMEGNERFGVALDHATSHYVCWSVWSSQESVDAYADRALQLAVDAVEHLRGHDPVTETLDLVYLHSRTPLHVGNWARLTRVHIPLEDLDRAVKFFVDLVLAWFDDQIGPIDILMAVDRETGVGRSMVCYKTLRALRESEPRTRELHGLLAAAIPDSTISEVSELQIVIAES